MLRSILKGQATGAPLFLAWSIGVFISYVLTVAVDALLSSSATWAGFTLGEIFQSLCQAVLLFTNWQRRALWVICFLLAVILPLTIDSLPILPKPMMLYGFEVWHFLTLAAFLQWPILIGIRKRSWLVPVFAISVGLSLKFAQEEIEQLVIAFYWTMFDYTHIMLLISYIHIHAFALNLGLGFIAAFFMPPITSEAHHNPPC